MPRRSKIKLQIFKLFSLAICTKISSPVPLGFNLSTGFIFRMSYNKIASCVGLPKLINWL